MVNIYVKEYVLFRVTIIQSILQR